MRTVGEEGGGGGGGGGARRQEELRREASMRMAVADTTTPLTTILDAMAEPAALCAGSGRVLHANAGARRMLAVPTLDTVLPEMLRLACCALRAHRYDHRVGGAPVAVEEHELDDVVVRVRALALGDDGAPPVLAFVEWEPLNPFSTGALRRYHLTPVERTVVRFLSARLTNAEIARALAISVRTVQHHVLHILAKLGVHSRREVGPTISANVSRGGPEAPNR